MTTEAQKATAMSQERLLLTKEIEEFLYHEADLLDERRFEEWLDLLTDDIHYWMPIRRNVKFGEQNEREDTKAGKEINWFDEGKDTLSQRVQQLLTGIHWAEEPLSRTSHMVTNVRIVEQSGDEVTIKCRFLVYRNRVETETDFLVGRREDLLRRVEGRWKIARRKIVLEQNVLLAKNLTLLF